MNKNSFAIKIKLLAILGFLILVTAPFVASATDNIVNGVLTGVNQKQLPDNNQISVISSIILPPSGATVINFDDKTQQCYFSNTIALTTEYLGTKGVTFAGPGGYNGGAILNECSNFGVTGHSTPNFLAFNIGSSMSNGGIPKGPETIIFNSIVSQVQINAGSSNAGTVIMTAYNAQNVSLGSAQITSTSALQTLSIQKAGIKKVVIQFTGDWLVLDDLAFLAVATPSVSIATDKSVYSPGGKMTVSVGIKNPTTSSVTADINVYIRSTDLGLNQKKASKRLTMPAGFDKTINKTISIGNLGSTSFNATWYIEMRETVSPFNLISEASTTWRYLPLPRSASEIKPEDIGNELAVQLLD